MVGISGCHHHTGSTTVMRRGAVGRGSKRAVSRNAPAVRSRYKKPTGVSGTVNALKRLVRSPEALQYAGESQSSYSECMPCRCVQGDMAAKGDLRLFSEMLARQQGANRCVSTLCQAEAPRNTPRAGGKRDVASGRRWGER
jgi:hypothetical protein